MSDVGHDERLRHAWSGAGADAERGDDCPADERIFDAVQGALDPEHVAELLEHSSTCNACARSWAMAVALSATEEPTIENRASPPRRTLKIVAALAAMILVVIIGYQTFGPSNLLPAGDRTTREAPTVTIRSQIEDGSPLPRDAFVLRWHGAPAGTLYSIEVATEDLTVLYRTTDTRETILRVPPQALEGLPAGTMLFWRVEGLLPERGTLTSQLFRVTLE